MSINVGSNPRVVMDTNVLYCALRSRSGASFKVLLSIRHSKLRLLLNQPILLEYEEILKRYSSDLNLSLANVDGILDGLCNLAELHSSTSYWIPKLRDPADETFAQLAFEGSADFLVTHNLRHFQPVAALGLNVLAPKQILGII